MDKFEFIAKVRAFQSPEDLRRGVTGEGVGDYFEGEINVEADSFAKAYSLVLDVAARTIANYEIVSIELCE